jgi:outer membrane immunogenic protein
LLGGGAAGVGYFDFSTIQCLCLSQMLCFAGNSTRTATGWTAGAGAEYRVPGTSASFKAEYLYVNLGGGDVVNVAGATTFAPLPGFHHGSFSAVYSTTDFHTVRFGLNWKL